MSRIVPAIIPESIDHLSATLEKLSGFVDEVQVDIVDGVFVPFTSWPYPEGNVDDLAPFADMFALEIDLMVAHPLSVIEAYVKAGAKRVVVHLESVDDLTLIVSLKKRYEFSLGLSLNNDTSRVKLTEVIQHADYVQCMGIAQIGSQGQPFDERVLDQIAWCKKEYPGLLISIDGSVNETTVPMLRAVGADRLVSGSAILKAENPRIAYEALEQLAQ